MVVVNTRFTRGSSIADPKSESGPAPYPANRNRRARTRSFPEPPLPEPFSHHFCHPTTGSPEVAVLDADGRIVGVNEAWREIVIQACPAEGARTKSNYVDMVAQIFPGLDRSALEEGVRRLLSGRTADFRLACVVQTPRGTISRQLHVTPLAHGEIGRFVAVHTDQTEIATARQALKDAAARIMSVRDDERQRIALELHDSTGQHLLAIRFGVSRLRRAGVDETVLDEIISSLDEAIRETRLLSYLMMPRDLDGHDLLTSVRQFLEGFARRTDLEVSLETSGPLEDLAPPLQHAALRIVQEALLNADRHAHARRVMVLLAAADGLLTISVADDGRGMRSMHGDARLGVGIVGMRARAQEFLGDLAISSDRTGTRIVAKLPLS